MVPRQSRSRNKSGLTPALINELKARNVSQAEIARMYGVSPSYVTWIKRNYGGVIKSPYETIRELWPWKVDTRFQDASVHKRLRDHLEFMALGNSRFDVSSYRRGLLRGFYRKLKNENLVVEFDPEIPPSDGIFTGGWAFRTKTTLDGDLIIRVNEHTRPLDTRAKMIWRFPPELPE